MGREPLLVMDEPTNGLDPLMQREFLALVADVRADGRTVFLSSHNLPEIERACDRVGIIRDGRLVDVWAVGDLLGEHWRSVNLVLAAPPPPGTFELPNVEIVALTGREVHVMVRGDVNPLLGRIAGLDVADVAITTPDIEDVFLRHYHAGNDAGPTAAAGSASARSAPAAGSACGGAAMIATFRLELRRNRGIVLWGSVVALVYGGVIAGFTRRSREQRADREYMAVFPKGFMAAFGMEGSLADGCLFNTYVGSWLLADPRGRRGDHHGDPPGGRGPRPRVLGCRSRRACRGSATSPSRSAGRSSRWRSSRPRPSGSSGRTHGRCAVRREPVCARWAARVRLGCPIAAVTTLLSVATLSGDGRRDRRRRGHAMYLLQVVSTIRTDTRWAGAPEHLDHFQLRPIIDEGTFRWRTSPCSRRRGGRLGRRAAGLPPTGPRGLTSAILGAMTRRSSSPARRRARRHFGAWSARRASSAGWVWSTGSGRAADWPARTSATWATPPTTRAGRRTRPRAKNRALICAYLPRLADHVAGALSADTATSAARLLVLGGDCTTTPARWPGSAGPVQGCGSASPGSTPTATSTRRTRPRRGTSGACPSR